MDREEAQQLTDKVLQLKARLDNPQENENLDVIAAEYDDLRQKLLEEMKACPYWFYKGDVERIFTEEELVAEGLLLSRKRVDYNQLPDLEQFAAHPNYEATPDCTDVYFFGLPGAGRLCLLMGIIGANGYGYSINFREKGGPEAMALKQYLWAGVGPKATPGKYVNTINASIGEKIDDEGGFVNHNVNFVRMSGEEFVHKIANNDDTVCLKDMGDGIKELLRNSNRKVFFIVIDPTTEILRFDYFREVLDDNGNVTGIEPIAEYIYQQSCISKFVSLFECEENKAFMKQVDAIHFIVTKADTLGKTQEERSLKAHALLINHYCGAVYTLIHYCRRMKRINRTTDFQPRIFTFSLGKFYYDGYEYDSKDSLYLIDALRHMTQGTKESKGLRKMFGHATAVVQPRPGDYGVKINIDK